MPRGIKAARIDPGYVMPVVIEDSDSENEDNIRSYEPIELLADAGIKREDISHLKENGFATIGQLFQISQRRLMGIKGIDERKIRKLLGAGKKIVPEKGGFTSASELIHKCKSKLYITTGSNMLDRILGGGIETMSVTEVHGEFRTGKTQLCHTLCVTTQLSRALGGGGGKVAFIDTEGTFRPTRVADISKRFNLDPSDVLDNIIVARAHTHEAQMDFVLQLSVIFADPEQEPFRLLIIDSLTALFRTDFTGFNELGERQQKLNRHLVRLVKLAEEFNIAVLVVNQVTADTTESTIPGSSGMKPVGGHIVSHGVHSRLLMSKGREDIRICKLIDSPCMPEAECKILLCNGGIADCEVA